MEIDQKLLNEIEQTYANHPDVGTILKDLKSGNPNEICDWVSRFLEEEFNEERELGEKLIRYVIEHGDDKQEKIITAECIEIDFKDPKWAEEVYLDLYDSNDPIEMRLNILIQLLFLNSKEGEEIAKKEYEDIKKKLTTLSDYQRAATAYSKLKDEQLYSELILEGAEQILNADDKEEFAGKYKSISGWAWRVEEIDPEKAKPLFNFLITTNDYFLLLDTIQRVFYCYADDQEYLDEFKEPALRAIIDAQKNSCGHYYHTHELIKKEIGDKKRAEEFRKNNIPRLEEDYYALGEKPEIKKLLDK